MNEHKNLYRTVRLEKRKVSPRPGIVPGPSTWQAEILTTRLTRIGENLEITNIQEGVLKKEELYDEAHLHTVFQSIIV